MPYWNWGAISHWKQKCKFIKSLIVNYLDVILAVPLVYGLIRGFVKGFVIEAASLVGLVLGVFVASILADIAGRVITAMFTWNPMVVKIMAFILGFVIVIVLVQLLARALEKVVHFSGLGLLNRILGMVAGFFKIAFMLGIILIFVSRLSDKTSWISRETLEGSTIYSGVSAYTHKLIPHRDYLGIFLHGNDQDTVSVQP